jgi:hypothetical protein
VIASLIGFNADDWRRLTKSDYNKIVFQLGWIETWHVMFEMHTESYQVARAEGGKLGGTPRKYPESIVKTARQMYRAKCRVKDISETLSVPESTVSDWVKS